MSVPLVQSTNLASIYARLPLVCQYAAARQRVSAIRNGLIAKSRRGLVQTSAQHQQERHSGVQCPSLLLHKGPRLHSTPYGQAWTVRRRGYKTVEEMRSRYKFGVCSPWNPFVPSSTSPPVSPAIFVPRRPSTALPIYASLRGHGMCCVAYIHKLICILFRSSRSPCLPL